MSKKIRFNQIHFVLLGILLSFLKLSFLYFFFELLLDLKGIIVHFHGDFKSYFDPILDYIERGEYTSKVRLPGYGFLLFLFKKLNFTNNQSFFSIIVVQYIFAGIANGLLIHFFYSRTFSKILTGLFIFFLYFNPFIFYDSYISTESLSTSLIIIIFIGLQYNWNSFLLGLFATWLFYLKPILAIVLIICFIFILLSKNIKKIILFFIPFVLIHGYWITYNFKKHNEVILVTKNWFYPEGEYGIFYGFLSLQEFLRAVGASHEFWKINSAAAWYFSEGTSNANIIKPINENDLKNRVVEPSSNVFTSLYTIDSLKLLRNHFTKIYLTQIRNTNSSIESECKSELKYVREKTKLYEESVKKEKPLHFYIISNYLRFKNSFLSNFFYNNQIVFSENEPSLLKKIVTIIKFAIKIPLKIFGVLGLLISLMVLFTKKFDLFLRILSLINLSVIFFYIVVFKQSEERYFMIIFPELVLLSFILLSKIRKSNA